MIEAQTLFITGTDTGVGKTRVATALLGAYSARGLRACGFKPVASGAETTAEGLRNDDALALLRASATPAPAYEELNPYCFAPAIAPHFAAHETGRIIEIPILDAAHARLAARHERVVVEGAGGWQVPLNETETFADWVGVHRWPVVMVVALRLGCLSHALLTAESIQRRTTLLGWVANRMPPAPQLAEEMIETLQSRLSAPLLGILPADASEEQAIEALARAAALA